jgi:hypothetical protein
MGQTYLEEGEKMKRRRCWRKRVREGTLREGN